jgi:hypothetical protein
VTNRLSYGMAPNTYTSERFSQTVRPRKMENAKQSSSWRGNSGRIINFYIYFENQAQGCARKNGKRISVPLGETTMDFFFFWKIGFRGSQKSNFLNTQNGILLER